MKPYLLTFGGHELWIDLHHVLGIHTPRLVDRMGSGGLFYTFAVELAFREPLNLSQSVEPIEVTTPVPDACFSYVNPRTSPEAYEPQTHELNQQWMHFVEAWKNK